MSGLVRIRSQGYNVGHLVKNWQSRHRTSGAVHLADQSTLLVTADTPVEAIEDLVRLLRGEEIEVEIIWREGNLLRA